MTWLNPSPRLNCVRFKEIEEWKQGCLTFQELILGPKAIILYAKKEAIESVIPPPNYRII